MCSAILKKVFSLQTTQPPKRLFAVVVTFNRLEKLKQTVARLLESPTQDLEGVLVVNNASTDGTDVWLAQQTDPRLIVAHMTENRGGAGGFEHGMRLITETHDPDWIVVMDDDGRPTSDTFAKFQAMDVSAWDGLAAAVYYPHGEICDMNRPSRNPFWHRKVFLNTLLGRGGRDGFHITPEDYQGQPKQIDVSSFVGLFVSRVAVAKVGYPDGRLFVYGEDGLYTLGLSKAGGQIGFIPDLKFEHDCSTFGEDDLRFRPLWKVYYYHRNLLMLYREAAGLFFVPLLFLVLPKWLLKTRHHKGEQRVFLKLLQHAVVDGLLRRTSVPHKTVLDWAKVAPEQSEI
ncbi:glycosyltransferase [Shimia sagamensis]|uniref:Glycosyltransferase, GT2 family n=1 Tax=Shimia sagamensis TaxID=1566352 RepID=A0ABY1NBR9_9RHOB|nr:glycosyltransferase [Shimia sagamensis]SMP05455.1 Glycosyltransferase, GT2 family [Shimia sagamensis]